MLRAILIFLFLGSTVMAANEKRMKQLSELSGVPLSRILKFQKRESASGKLLSGDGGMSGGDLHLYKKTAQNIALKLKDKELYNRIKGLSTKPSLKKGWSEYSQFLILNPEIQDKLLVRLLKDTKKATEDFVRKEFNREPEDHEHYAFWNASPPVAKIGIKSRFMSDNPKLKVLQKNIKGFLAQKKSYLEDTSKGLLIPTDKSKIPSWMKQHGLSRSDMKKSDGSWYHPGDTIAKAEKASAIPGEENVEKEWEQFKEHLIRDPYYGTEVDIPKAELPKPEIDVPDLPEPEIDVPDLPEPEIKPEEMPLDMGIEWEEEQLVAAKGGEVRSRGYNEGGYVDSWRQPPEVEEVDEEMVTKQTAEMEDPDEDIIGQMSIEEIEETRESIPLDDPRREQLNSIIGDKKYEQENPEDLIDDRPTGAADSTPLPVKFQSRGQTTYPGEEPAPWDEVKDVDDTTVEWSEESSVSGEWETPTDKTVKEGPSKEELKIKQDMKAVESQQDFLRTQRAELDNEIKKYMDDELELTKIDPERFWKNKGTLDKIVAIVGQAAGAYHAARFKTKNLWKEDIDKAIDQDIAAQKLDNLNTIKMKNAAYKRIQLMTDRYKNLVSDDQSQQRLDMMGKHYAGIRMKNLKEYFTATQESKAHRMLNRPLSTDELNALSFKYPKQKVRERAIMGRDGKFYLAADENEARKLRSEVIPEAEKAINAAAELTQLTKDIGFLDKMNPFSEKKAQAKTLRESLKGALRLEIFGPGVMTDTERKIADQVVGDPNKLFTMDKTEIAKLETLMGKLSYGIRQRLRRSGLNFPPSQNEQRIKQLLALRKQKDIPQNRKKIVDDLVRSQQKAEKIGSKKVFWIFNEPLPI